MLIRAAIVAFVAAGVEEHAESLRELARALPEFEVVGVATKLSRAQKRACGDVRVEVLGEELGRGAALRAGLNMTHAQYVAVWDLDARMDPSLIRAVFDLVENDNACDAMLVKLQDEPKTRRAFRAALRDAGLRAVSGALLGLKAADLRSPVKIFRKAALLTVFEQLRLYNLGFDAELMFHVRRAQLTVREVTVKGSVRPRAWDAAGAARALARLAAIRAINGSLAHLPYVNLLGRRYSIPAKRSYSILMNCWRDPRNPLAGGGEVYLYEQARCWARAGHNVTWFAQRFPGAPAEEMLDGIRIVRRGRFPFVFLQAALWYLFRSDRRFDFIVDCMNGIPFFTPLYSTKPKVCLVYHVHSHHFREELPRPLSDIAIAVETKLVPLVYRNTKFLTISESTKAEMEQLNLSRGKIALVHSGVSPALRAGEKAPVPTILHLGRLKKYKRVRLLIDAFRQVKQRVPDARLVIAGTGDDEADLRRYAAAKGVRDVCFMGRVTEEMKARLMQEAWVFAMPSSIEGWGIVVVEANACGTPAVAFNVPGLRDCIRHGETGFLAADQAQFTRALADVLTDAQLRADLSAAALAWSREFTWDAAAARTLHLIRRLQPWRAVFEPDLSVPNSWTLQVPADLP